MTTEEDPRSIDALNAKLWEMFKELGDTNEYPLILQFRYKIYDYKLNRYINVEIEELKRG